MQKRRAISAAILFLTMGFNAPAAMFQQRRQIPMPHRVVPMVNPAPALPQEPVPAPPPRPQQKPKLVQPVQPTPEPQARPQQPRSVTPAQEAKPTIQQAQPTPQTRPQQPQVVTSAQQPKPALQQTQPKVQARPAQPQAVTPAQQPKPAIRAGLPKVQARPLAAPRTTAQAPSPQAVQQAVSTGGAQIPQQQFQARFGTQHRVRIQDPVVVNGQTQFFCAGYYFVVFDPWPTFWGWDDDYFIEYIDGEYFLVDPFYPTTLVEVIVVY
jgi:hypothetical protein